MFNYLDGAFIAIILLNALSGYWRGINLEILGLVRIILAALIATIIHIVVMPEILRRITEDYVDPGILYAVTLLIVFGITWIVLKFIISALILLIKVTDNKSLTEQILGAIAGMFKGFIIVVLLVMAAEYTPISTQLIWHQSWIAKKSSPIAGEARKAFTYTNSIVRERIETILRENSIILDQPQ